MRLINLINIINQAIIFLKGCDSLQNAELIEKILREQRKKRKKSQEVLSGLAGLDRTHYSKLERGLQSPNIETLFKISYALGMKPSELMAIIETAVFEENSEQ